MKREKMTKKMKYSVYMFRLENKCTFVRLVHFIDNQKKIYVFNIPKIFWIFFFFFVGRSLLCFASHRWTTTKRMENGKIWFWSISSLPTVHFSVQPHDFDFIEDEITPPTTTTNTHTHTHAMATKYHKRPTDRPKSTNKIYAKHFVELNVPLKQHKFDRVREFLCTILHQRH